MDCNFYVLQFLVVVCSFDLSEYCLTEIFQRLILSIQMFENNIDFQRFLTHSSFLLQIIYVKEKFVLHLYIKIENK